MKGRLITTFLLLLFFISGWAQKGRITGSVVDENEESLPYAAISIISPVDSIFLTGDATDENGAFELRLDPGQYILQIDFIGYQRYSTEVFTHGKDDYNFGVLRLQPDMIALDEVVIEETRSRVQFKLDKRVYNVDSDISSVGSSADQVLDNLPSVEVSVEGTVSLRGSQGVRILIDGKPSGLIGVDGSNALKSIQASMIEKVELITNPGAKYEAEGEAGIINIVLKKQREKGLNGSFDLRTGLPERAGVGANINLRKDKLNFFTNIAADYRSGPGGGFNNQTYVVDGETLKFNSTRDIQRENYSLSSRFGMEYFFTDKNSLTMSGTYRWNDGENVSTVEYEDIDAEGNTIAESTRTDVEQEPSEDIELDLTHRLNIGENKDHVWSTVLQYSLNDETEISEYNESIKNSSSLVQQRSSNTQDQWRFLAKTDYVKPITDKSKFEAGLRAEVREISNDYTVEQLDDELGYQTLPGFDDELAYREEVYAVYGSWGQEFERFSFQSGLRLEYTDIETRLLESGRRNQRDYTNLFPTLALSYSVNDNNQLQMSYSRRISRPRFWYLMPFLTFSDSRVRFQGNPDLNPEFTNSMEVGYLKYFDKASILSTIYYRQRLAPVTRIRVVDETGITNLLPVNLDEENSVGLEVSTNYDMSTKLSWNANANFFYSNTYGAYQDQYFRAVAISMYGRTSLSWKVQSDFKIQLDYNYRAPRRTAQGKRLAIHRVGLSASKDVLKGKGTISISTRDLLNTRIRRSIIDTEDLMSVSEFQWRVRGVILNFNYRLNQKKGRRPSGGPPSEGGF